MLVIETIKMWNDEQVSTVPTHHKDVIPLNIHRTHPEPVRDEQKGNTEGHFILSVR